MKLLQKETRTNIHDDRNALKKGKLICKGKKNMKSRNYKKGLKIMIHTNSMKKNAMSGVIFTRTPLCYNKHDITE